MADDRPVLIGMNNPYGVDPHYALYPLPARATGARIYEMLQGRLPHVRMTNYRDVFDRRNVLTGPWTIERARPAAQTMLAGLTGRTVMLLGKDVRRAFGIDGSAPPVGSDGGVVNPDVFLNWIPHPSGRNHWYNDPDNLSLVAAGLERLYLGERGWLWVTHTVLQTSLSL